ncbi:MAG: hypothetical protein QM791_02270 [Ferruginibacter sp.]
MRAENYTKSSGGISTFMMLLILKTALGVFVFTITSHSSFCQSIELIEADKRITTYITDRRDTLTKQHKAGYKTDIGIINYEFNRVNGKLNGPSIGYHQNGSIYSIIYYLDDKPWETRLLIDSFGKQHFPGTLKNGNGYINFISEDGIDLGFTTYKNGLRTGKYHRFINGGTTLLEGELSYRPDLIKYDTLTLINFTFGKDTIQAFLSNGKCYDMVCGLLFNDSTKSKAKILSSQTHTYVSSGEIHSYLGISLEQGEIPIGHWELSVKKTNKKQESYEFNNDGKLLSLTTFNIEDGTIRQNKVY